MKKFVLLFLIIVLSNLTNTRLFAQLEYPGDVDILGSAEVIFSSSTDSCSSQNIPDAPVRFFRDANNQIQVIISHFEGYRMTGPDFNSLSVDCSNGPVWTSDFNTDPSNYNNKEWLTGLYTLDGKTIYALVHNEHEGDVASNWYNSVTLAVSNDTGKTYSHAAPPSHLVASIPYTYHTGMGPAGVFEPSNIIYHDGYYYVFLHMESYGLQETGASLMRTQDLSDPTSWEVWDGQGFNNTFINPYTETGYDPADHIAAILDYDKIEKMHSSITWNTYFNKFLLVGAAQKNGKWGFYYSLSDDLIHWTVRKLIMEANVNIHAQSGSDVYGYPAIVDHNDTTRNFEVSGREVYLYYSRWPYGQNYNRTLERIPIRFNKMLVNGFEVTGKGDNEDTNLGDGIATTQFGKTSLRSAIEESNSRPPWYKDSVITISFNISGTGVQTITLKSYLPSILYPVVIDGYTQPGSAPNSNALADGSNAEPMIELNTDGNTGLTIESNNTTIKGLIINQHVGTAINIFYSDSCRIEGNFIGTSADGLSNPKDDSYGIRIENGSYNTIGGTSPEKRNVILGGININGSSSFNNTVAGNYIGTDKTGTAGLSKNASGIEIVEGAHNNIVGGADSLSRNIISGNWMSGIVLSDGGVEQNKIFNNYIGVSADGNSPVPNNFDGVNISDTANFNYIGRADAPNIIAGNGESGIRVENSSNISIKHNYIGTNASCADLGNDVAGVLLFNNTTNDNVDSNVVAFNGDAGVAVAYGASKYNSILYNSIYRNGRFGIDLQWDAYQTEVDLMDEDDGPNGLQNFPEISSATETDSLVVTGTFKSKPDGSYKLQFFASDSADASGYGEGQNFIGEMNVALDNSGQTDFRFALPASNYAWKYVTATATDDSNNTSEFSNAVLIRGNVAKISVSPQSIFSDVDPNSGSSENFTISNVGVETMNWSVEWSSSWLSISNTSGSVSPGGADTLLLEFSAAGLTQDQYYYDTLIIRSNDPVDSVVFVPVEIHVGTAAADVEVSTDSLWVGINSEDTVDVGVYLANYGSKTVTWYAESPDKSWMEVTSSSDTLGGNQMDTVLMSFNSSGLSAGDYSNVLNVFVDDTTNPFKVVKVVMNVGSYPKIALDKDSLIFEIPPGGVQTLQVNIENPGNEDLEWEVHTTFYSKWIKVSPNNGITPPGMSSFINVNVSANDLDSSNSDGVIMVQSNDPNVDEARVQVLAIIKDPTGITDGNKLPDKFELSQNYPNPFNPTTTIKYSIPTSSPLAKGRTEEGFVTLKIYDVLGREVATLVNEAKSPGYYSVNFNAVNLPSGLYFYKLTAGGFSQTKKMILMK